VIDIVPTLFDLAGIPTELEDRMPLPGKSLRPLFQRDTDWHREIWYYHGGNRAVRVGDWKLVAAKDEPWELYNLSNDRTESVNLAKTHPEKVAEMEKRWMRMLKEIELLENDQY
tara:strand:- start:261 stop:602 length:342 start_codon:yes stop_codon:yes gene_type:complete